MRTLRKYMIENNLIENTHKTNESVWDIEDNVKDTNESFFKKEVEDFIRKNYCTRDVYDTNIRKYRYNVLN